MMNWNNKGLVCEFIIWLISVVVRYSICMYVITVQVLNADFGLMLWVAVFFAVEIWVEMSYVIFYHILPRRRLKFGVIQ